MLCWLVLLESDSVQTLGSPIVCELVKHLRSSGHCDNLNNTLCRCAQDKRLLSGRSANGHAQISRFVALARARAVQLRIGVLAAHDTPRQREKPLPLVAPSQLGSGRARNNEARSRSVRCYARTRLPNNKPGGGPRCPSPEQRWERMKAPPARACCLSNG